MVRLDMTTMRLKINEIYENYQRKLNDSTEDLVTVDE